MEVASLAKEALAKQVSVHSLILERKLMPEKELDTILNAYGMTQPGDVLPPVPSFGKEWCLMSTYEEFMILLTFVGLIIAILNYHDKHKK